MNYAIGFLAGIFDGLGMIAARNKLYSIGRPSGRRMDGFDASADIFIRF